MLSRTYLEKLNVYLGKKIDISDNPCEITVYMNCETQYILRKCGQCYILYIKEREVEKKLKEYMSEEEMKRNFAIWMKNIFCDSIKYRFSGKFREVKNVSELRDLMYQYTNGKWYSINKLTKDRINLEEKENGLFSIFFVDKEGKKYILEEDEEAPFVFKRFYNEVMYYEESIKQIEEYERIFEDKLEYKTKIEMLGYN